MESAEATKPRKTQRKAPRVRHDPPPSDDSLSMYMLDVVNKDPEMHYCWAATNSPTMGPARFEMMGYHAVEYSGPNGPRARVGMRGIKPGEQILVEGNILMACTKEHKANLDQNGGPGAGMGLAWADKLQRKLIKTHRQGDHMRGQFRPTVLDRQEDQESVEMVDDNWS